MVRDSPPDTIYQNNHNWFLHAVKLVWSCHMTPMTHTKHNKKGSYFKHRYICVGWPYVGVFGLKMIYESSSNILMSHDTCHMSNQGVKLLPTISHDWMNVRGSFDHQNDRETPLFLLIVIWHQKETILNRGHITKPFSSENSIAKKFIQPLKWSETNPFFVCG